MNAKHLAATLLLALAAPSHALFDLGNVGLPTHSPVTLAPTDPPLPPIPPTPPPPIAIPPPRTGRPRRSSTCPLAR